MRALNRMIDKFCYKHPRFGISRLMLYITIGNALVFLFSMMDRTGLLLNSLYFDAGLILRGQVWRIVTFIFMPAYVGSSSIIWEALLLYFYYFIGSSLENAWGKGRFNIYYFSGVLLTAIYGFVMYFITGKGYAVDLEYLNLAMFFAFATLYPDTRFMLFFFIPIKAKWMAIVDAVFFIISIVINPFPINLLPLVAILNYFIFFWDELIHIFITPLKYKTSPKTINFKRAAKQARRENRKETYTRKCSVCGRTDADYPDLEFRYCSKCKGYHCFCIDHINNHVHFDS